MHYISTFYFHADVINFKIYLRSSCKSMAGRKKEGKTKIENFEYLENEQNQIKSDFLNKIKKNFHNYLRVDICEKTKNGGHKC